MNKSEQQEFAKFGTTFQEKTMQAFLTDPRWAEQMIEVFNPDFFESKYLQYLSDKVFTFAKKYKGFPTLQLLVSIVSDDLKQDGMDSVLRGQVVDYLKRIRNNPDANDLPFVKEKSLEFCKRQSLKSAIESSIDHLNAGKYDLVVETIKKAVAAGASTSIGHDFDEDCEARFVRLARNPIMTGLDQLDAKGVMNGGLGSGELGVVMAPTGIGKSHFLVMLGANALRNKKCVLHYTFELSETNVGIRYDSNLCDIPSNDVIDKKDDVMKHYADNKYGKLIIKEFPMNFATVHTLRAHFEKVMMAKGVRPDMIIIDYADIMRSSRKYDDLRHELKLIYEELRAWASEIKIPIWTASQTNRSATESDVIGTDSMSESYGKAMTADVILTLSRKRLEKASGWGRLFVAKNRAGKDGLLFTMKIDTAKSNFLLHGEETLEAASAEDESQLKKAISNKLRELEDTNIAKTAA